MGKYSVPADIKDKLIFNYSQEADHEEAEGYVGKVLSRMGVDVDNVDITQLMRDLSITYATYKRAFYEFKMKDGIFHEKYLWYESKLGRLTTELIATRGKIPTIPRQEPDDLVTGD